MATEIAFAKSFLTLLDSKPTKINPDHVEDAHNYPATTPYILPRLPSQRPLPKPSPSGAAPGSEPSVTVTVRSLRNPPLEVRLTSLAVGTTSVLDIKNAVGERADIAVHKLKLLYNKKPVGDSKTLRDVLGDAQTKEVEFSVMVMGGAAAVGTGTGTGTGKNAKQQEESVAQGLSGEGVLETEEFWSDLNGFLQQRIRDAKVAGEVTERFKAAWKGRG